MKRPTVEQRDPLDSQQRHYLPPRDTRPTTGDPTTNVAERFIIFSLSSLIHDGTFQKKSLVRHSKEDCFSVLFELLSCSPWNQFFSYTLSF